MSLYERSCINVLFAAVVVFCLVSFSPGTDSDRYYVTSATVKFRSEAALEIITAESKSIQGIVDIRKKTFAFSILNGSFNGFNSTLQREHFNENYLESEKFPTTVFKGKIIEDVDFSKTGTYDIRAKGVFVLHGITREKIIHSNVTISDGGFNIDSRFIIKLSDFDIKVPKVVHEKVAEEILVEVKMRLDRK